MSTSKNGGERLARLLGRTHGLALSMERQTRTRITGVGVMRAELLIEIVTENIEGQEK
jgi:hypothetical protein